MSPTLGAIRNFSGGNQILLRRRMGQGGSTLRLPGKPDDYKKDAVKVAKLPDDILTLFFKDSNFIDYLALADVNKCGYYVFTTAAALEQLFVKIKVSPKIGKSGEIYFAPLSDLSPLVPTPSGQKKEVNPAKQEYQKKACVDVAYFFVRSFQTYAALSLSVMDTDPTRRSSLSGPPPAARMKLGAQKISFAPAAGGGRGEAPVQRGGNVSSQWYSVIGTGFGKYVNDSLLAPLTQRMKSIPSQPVWYISRDTTTLKLEIKSEQFSTSATSIDGRASIEKGGKIVQAIFGMQKESDTVINLLMNGNLVLKFVKVIGGNWKIADSDGTMLDDASDQKFFVEQLMDYADGILQAGTSVAPVGSSAVGRAVGPNRVTSFGTSTIGLSSAGPGSAAFEGFDEIKRPFFNRGKRENKLVFPKAYAVGRAMQLLSPIFESEKVSSQPYSSLICTKNLDFESSASPWMPREDASVRANIYYRSLVALYYDNYQIRGNELTFIKTETGNTDLRVASALIGNLYGLSGREAENYLEGNMRFRKLTSCSVDTRITITLASFARDLQNKVIKPLLDLQQAQNRKVEAILKKMFVVKYDKDKKTPMRLEWVPSYLKGGNDSVNKIAKEARDLLVDYYKKAEAYYILGVQMFEENKGAWSV